MQTSQFSHFKHPEIQGKHLSCCSSQKVPNGHEGTFPVSGFSGSGCGLATHLKVLASQSSVAAQVTHACPL